MGLIKIQKCASAEPWFEIHVDSNSEKGKTYRVLVPWPDDGVDDLCCECKGFQFRGICIHQEEAFEILCRWEEGDEEKQTESQRMDHCCPRCGDETVEVTLWEP